MEQKSIRNKGFTLIELSIVVVIIGLIVAGVVAGQSLVTQAKYRTVISDLEKFDTALTAYKMQYNGLPGDMSNAESFFGTETVAGGSGTINGDGNRQVFYNVGTEPFRFWEQLSVAGLLPGNFYGSGTWGDADSITANKIPSSPFPNQGYQFQYSNGHAGYFGLVGHIFMFQGIVPWGHNLTPSQAYALDAKMDDGLPDKGSLIGIGVAFGANCADAVGSGYNYNLDYATNACWVQKVSSIQN